MKEPRTCRACGKDLVQKVFASGPETSFYRRVYCDRNCFSTYWKGKPTQARLEKEQSGRMACGKCGVVKALVEFPKKGKKRDGMPRYSYCKPCHSEYQRAQKLRRDFGLSVGDYEKLIDWQGGVCAICKRPPKSNRLSVDHRHRDGLIRGGLCFLCNRILGMFNDDIERFESAVLYLVDPPATRCFGEPRYGTVGRTGAKSTLAIEKSIMNSLLSRGDCLKKELRSRVNADTYSFRLFDRALRGLVEKGFIETVKLSKGKITVSATEKGKLHGRSDNTN